MRMTLRSFNWSLEWETESKKNSNMLVTRALFIAYRSIYFDQQCVFFFLFAVFKYPFWRSFYNLLRIIGNVNEQDQW